MTCHSVTLLLACCFRHPPHALPWLLTHATCGAPALTGAFRALCHRGCHAHCTGGELPQLAAGGQPVERRAEGREGQVGEREREGQHGQPWNQPLCQRTHAPPVRALGCCLPLKYGHPCQRSHTLPPAAPPMRLPPLPPHAPAPLTPLRRRQRRTAAPGSPGRPSFCVVASGEGGWEGRDGGGVAAARGRLAQAARLPSGLPVATLPCAPWSRLNLKPNEPTGQLLMGLGERGLLPLDPMLGRRDVSGGPMLCSWQVTAAERSWRTCRPPHQSTFTRRMRVT